MAPELGQFGAPATVSSSGRAVERLPLLAQDAVRRGHEVSAHGWRWEGHADLDEAEDATASRAPWRR
jgi:allantoinase